MKYQVGFIYTFEGELSVEAESEAEAVEILRDITFSDPFNEPDIDGNGATEVLEIYEWDDNAQEKFRQLVQKQFEELKEVKQNGN